VDNGIKILVSVGYDARHKKQTEEGIYYGKEVAEEVELTSEEAAELIQALVSKLSYQDGQKFVKKYKK